MPHDANMTELGPIFIKGLAFAFVFLFIVLWGSKEASAATIYVDIIANGFFSPKDITINTGDTVVWTDTIGGYGVATDQHLIHKQYPDPECPVSNCWQSSTLSLDETFSFTFMIASTDETPTPDWGYHNHEKAARKGSITVIDLSAPATTADLAASNPGSGSVNLTWTSPGNDVGNTGNFRTPASYDVRYSTSVITESNWSSATSVTGEPTPQAAGSSESMTVSGLQAETTYYFALKTTDDAPTPNISALSNSVSATTLEAGSPTPPPPSSGRTGIIYGTEDILFPEVIADLAVEVLSATSVELTWTAPGGDGHAGIISSYDIRYNTKEITVDTWQSSTQVTDVPAPKAIGSSESFIVSGLASGITYYFALSSTDPVGQEAKFSNVVQARIGPPLDRTPPSAITDLTLESISVTKGAVITWTAPGDDGNVGRAVTYDVRFGPDPVTGAISDENWDSVYFLIDIPIPSVAGSKESMVALGLNHHSVTYHIAIKVLDEQGNESSISNLLSFTTPPAGFDTGEVHMHEDGGVHIHEIEDEEEKVAPVALREGALFRYADDDKIYIVKGGERIWIETQDAFNRAGYSWDDVIVMPSLVTAEIAPKQYDVNVNTDGSFSPSVLNINTGDTVRWTSIGDNHQVSSNRHPIHTFYPDPVCPDAGCWDSPILFTGDTYYFTFLIPGTMGYHNHKKANRVATLNISDINAPATITDLAASSPTLNSIDLSWTSPGDDVGSTGNFGASTFYDVRYSASLISEGNWILATPASREPIPQATGLRETMTVLRLSASTVYSIALKSTDKSGNESPLSNVITFTTLPSPKENPAAQGVGEPRLAPLPFFEGDLIKTRYDQKVYVIKNERRLWIPTQDSFSEAEYNWNEVKDVSVSEVTSILAVNLVRMEGKPEVYAITGDRKRYIPGPAAFINEGYIWDNIVLVSEVEAAWYPDTNLLRETNGTKIYFIEGVHKRWIQTQDAFIKRGYNWNDVTEVPLAVLDGYTTGEAITEEFVKRKPQEHTISIDAGGFTPQIITITTGDTVRWVNTDTDFHWPASDVHPTHTDYRGFDPLKAIRTGEEWSFVLDKVGEWGVHDHLNPINVGKITVLEPSL